MRPHRRYSGSPAVSILDHRSYGITDGDLPSLSTLRLRNETQFVVGGSSSLPTETVVAQPAQKAPEGAFFLVAVAMSPKRWRRASNGRAATGGGTQGASVVPL